MSKTEQEINLERREFIKDLLSITALGAIIFGGGYDGFRRAGKFAKIESEISNATKEELAKQNITPPTQEELKQLTEIDRKNDNYNVVYNRTSEEIKQAQNILARKKATDTEEKKQRDKRSGETPSKVVIYGEGVAASGAFAAMAKKLGLL